MSGYKLIIKETAEHDYEKIMREQGLRNLKIKVILGGVLAGLSLIFSFGRFFP